MALVDLMEHVFSPNATCEPPVSSGSTNKFVTINKDFAITLGIIRVIARAEATLPRVVAED